MGSFATTGGTGLTSSNEEENGQLSPVRKIFVFCLLVLHVSVLTPYLLVRRERISLRLARQLRATLMRDTTWRWWQLGFKPWFALNFMLMRLDKKKERLASIGKSSSRALDAFCRVRQACRQDRDIHLIFDLWREFQLRTPKEFESRDLTYFMNRMGSLFSDPAKTLIQEAVLMSQSEYLMFKYLCHKGTNFIDARLKRIGPMECALVDYFISHRDECCNQIMTFRASILSMARHYVSNMIATCINAELPKEIAHLWARAGQKIVRIQETELTDENRPQILEDLNEFFRLSNEACAPVFVLYQELQRRAELEAEQEKATLGTPLPNKPADDTDPALLAALKRWPKLHRPKIGRFKFTWNHLALTITDTKHRETDRSYVKFEDITANSELDILEELMTEFNNGYGKPILPLGKEGWQSNMKSPAACDFKNRETQTWADAYPEDQKEVKRLHIRYRRIIPDGQPLRVPK